VHPRGPTPGRGFAAPAFKTWSTPTGSAAALCLAHSANLHASDPYTVFLDPDPSVYTGFWDIAGAPGGEVYAAGFVIENDDPAYEVVLRSLDRGATWETASVVTDSHGTFINAAVDGAGNVFVAGYRPVTSGRTTLTRWMVARGTPADGGALNWSVVDELTVDSKYGSFATGLAVRPSNDPTAPSEVWVRGTVGSKSGDRVVLRRSGPSGAWILQRGNR
jgi:hypothetical protein